MLAAGKGSVEQNEPGGEAPFGRRLSVGAYGPSTSHTSLSKHGGAEKSNRNGRGDFGGRREAKRRPWQSHGTTTPATCSASDGSRAPIRNIGRRAPPQR